MKRPTNQAIADALGVTFQAVHDFLGKRGRKARDFPSVAKAVEFYRREASPRKEVGTVGDETARLKAFQADLAELELAEKRGEVMNAELVRSVVAAASVIFASQLEGLPSRVAGELAAATDPALIRKRLRDETSRIRRAVAEEFRKLAVGADGGSDPATTGSGGGSVGGSNEGTATG